MISEKKVCSGYPGLDKKLDYIRAGDNLVLRVLDLEFFRYFAQQFIVQAKKDGRQVHYVRFAGHKPMIYDMDNIIMHRLDPKDGFETFTVELYKIIISAQHEAFFIFDNISILGETWNTDLMLGNFFKVTCPFFTKMEDVAIFPLRRGEHSYDCIEQIREWTQIFLDVFYKNPYYYITPLKVQDRYNGSTFLTHRLDPEMNFLPLTYSTSLSKYYAAVDEAGPGEQLQDSWDRFFALVRMNYATRINTKHYHKKMCEMLMTSDPRMSEVILNNFKTRDYLMIQSRMVGTGRIGGKACGMLTARQIVINNCPEIADHFEPHDSHYIGSDIYYTYIIHNNFWNLWLEHKADPANVDIAKKIEEKLLHGNFPVTIRSQFKRLLDYYGSSPIIARSSSFLEDGFGNAFAGKYESVFCINSGTLDERLEAFEKAIRIVYASTMSPSALEYRRRRGLLEHDEQMAILVQRVSGSRLENFYFPMAAGVGYSYNSYPWAEGLDPNAGMLRLVAGLGTRAVDRTPGDYPRLVNLDFPKKRVYNNMADRHKYSQRRMDVLDIEKNELLPKPIQTIYPIMLPWNRKKVFTHDTDAESMFYNRGQSREVLFVDCENLIDDQEFVQSMQTILKTIEKNYGTPVDIEYTINTSEDEDFVINLLQCRPLVAAHSQKVDLPVLSKENTFLHVVKNTMGTSRNIDLDVVVYVDPYEYYTLNYNDKPNIARLIGKINQRYKDKGLKMLLITPGRIGTSSPELGVPVTFAEISEFNSIMEVAYSKVGYMPELSFGSHMFQDLVEAEILYIACLENKDTILYRPEFLENYQRCCEDIIGEANKKIIQVYEPKDLMLVYDNLSRELICGKKKEE
ncbi:MAG: PEP/pyruvate-binding domain-containing protein [Bacillota bacterium]|nr:PEP/pyruvate-binding domain-containing protein [Bacillota bacterium]